MSKINWDIVDRDTFKSVWDYSAEDIAGVFVKEAFSDEPDETRLNTLHELGQGRFSMQNNREQREALFMQFVNRLAKERA